MFVINHFLSIELNLSYFHGSLCSFFWPRFWPCDCFELLLIFLSKFRHKLLNVVLLLLDSLMLLDKNRWRHVIWFKSRYWRLLRDWRCLKPTVEATWLHGLQIFHLSNPVVQVCVWINYLWRLFTLFHLGKWCLDRTIVRIIDSLLASIMRRFHLALWISFLRHFVWWILCLIVRFFYIFKRNFMSHCFWIDVFIFLLSWWLLFLDLNALAAGLFI